MGDEERMKKEEEGEEETSSIHWMNEKLFTYQRVFERYSIRIEVDL